MLKFPITIDKVNSLGAEDFLLAFGDVAEHAPWVAEKAMADRPFADRRAMTETFIDAVFDAGEPEKLALIRGHPDLAGRAAIDGGLAEASKREQSGAGLDRLTAEEFARFTALNNAYRKNFDFPFILAVKGIDKHGILRSFEDRLDNDSETEFFNAIRQIVQIVAFRIEERVSWSQFDPNPIGERALTMIEALASISAGSDQLTRLYLTPEHKRASVLVGEWMKQAGLSVHMDAAASMHGFLPAGRAGFRSAKRLLIASHIDTVVDGGRYDGSLGVVAGILAIEELRARGIALPFGLEIIAFGDEEGVRFPKTLIGSSAISGMIEPSILEITDHTGETLREALLEFDCDPTALHSEAYSSEEIIGYLEVHIEQGPVLDQSDEPLGVVTAIAAQSRHRIRVSGEAGHAGTVPMALRRDALAGAAEIISTVEALAHSGHKDNLVATVGEVSISPGAVNVIPGEALLSLDVRAKSDEARARTVENLRERLHQIGARRGVVIGFETVHEKSVVVCAPWLRAAISSAIEQFGGRNPQELMSGAGHDGLAMAYLTDIGMIFVRCRSGISHNPLEHVSVPDMGYAVEALIRTILEIAREDTE